MKALSLVKPEKEEIEHVNKLAKIFLEKLNSKLKDAKAVIGGSVAKGTWLKGGHDIDIFVQYPLTFKDKDISALLEKDLKKLFKDISRVHGSRDYFKIEYSSYIFEIIPVLKVSSPEKAENITDSSPFHTEWVKSKVNESLQDEIRLTRAFCKANKIYGAESYIKGFSGFVTEILTINYGSFEKLIKAAMKWKPGDVIGDKQHAKKLNEAKLSPLIVIDPTCSSRNAAAALSEKKFNKFIEKAKEFYHNPSPSYFEIKTKDLEELKDALILKAIPLERKSDIAGAKLLKAQEYIKTILNQNGFNVTEHDMEFGSESLLWFFTEKKEVPKKFKHFGPPLKETKHVEVFKERYPNYKIENDRIFVELERKHTHINQFVKDLISSDPYIKEKVKSIAVVNE